MGGSRGRERQPHLQRGWRASAAALDQDPPALGGRPEHPRLDLSGVPMCRAVDELRGPILRADHSEAGESRVQGRREGLEGFGSNAASVKLDANADGVTSIASSSTQIQGVIKGTQYLPLSHGCSDM